MTRAANLLAAGLALVAALSGTGLAGEKVGGPHLDTRVRQFLDSHRDEWRDMNVPAVDGRLLHNLVLENGYTRALEIGTSTGHSTIWIAWALSKTGGTLVTIEIDERRHRKALENIAAAGLADYVDSRQADAKESGAMAVIDLLKWVAGTGSSVRARCTLAGPVHPSGLPPSDDAKLRAAAPLLHAS